LQLASIYFFLHFQYNGWFMFACFGLAHHWLQRQGIFPKHASFVFWAFALTSIPTYLLSVLWWNIPSWLYALVVSAVILQTETAKALQTSALNHFKRTTYDCNHRGKHQNTASGPIGFPFFKPISVWIPAGCHRLPPSGLANDDHAFSTGLWLHAENASA